MVYLAKLLLGVCLRSIEGQASLIEAANTSLVLEQARNLTLGPQYQSILSLDWCKNHYVVIYPIIVKYNEKTTSNDIIIIISEYLFFKPKL